MNLTGSSTSQPITRRRFLTTAACGVAGLALYGGEVERHWIEMVHRDIAIRNLPAAFEGLRIAQLSDIHLDEFTEPFMLVDAIHRINQLNPDIVLLTGDFVSQELLSKRRTIPIAWQCAELLKQIACKQVYACMGNHDVYVGEQHVIDALTSSGIPVLKNAFLPLERNGGRIWLAGVDDPFAGRPDIDKAIPAMIRNQPHEPVVLMCHAPDYVDKLIAHPAGSSVALVLSGHTHGGQVRLPIVGPLKLPPGGRKYVEGLFRFGQTQLYVNRGLGTVGLPIRFDCPPEITEFVLRAA